MKAKAKKKSPGLPGAPPVVRTINPGVPKKPVPAPKAGGMKVSPTQAGIGVTQPPTAMPGKGPTGGIPPGLGQGHKNKGGSKVKVVKPK